MDWVWLVIALIETGIGLAPNFQVPTELPTTVISLVGLVVIVEAGIIYVLLKQLFAMAAKNAELANEQAKATALFAKSLDEVTEAVREGHDVDALARKIDELTLQTKTPLGRSRKGQT